MEDLREAARCYLEGASEEYKQQARRAMAGGESLEDFYVRATNRCIRRCDVCAKLLLGFYLCCTKCELYKGSNYNLCVKCFYGRTFQHNHDSFADNHSVLMMHNEGRGEPTCVIEKDKGKSKQDSNSIRHLSSSKDSSSHSNSLRRKTLNSMDSSHSNPSLRRSIPGSTDSSHSKSIIPVPNLRDSSHSNSSLRRSIPGSTDSSHSKSIIPVPNLRESSHSNSLRRSISGSTDSSHSHSIRLSATKIKIDENGIKKLAKIADAHYNAAPDYIRAYADKFFWSMVKQEGKTSVTMEDFVESMKEKGYLEYANQELFEMVVKDRNVGMDITESRTVYYIVVSGRPFCSWCRYLIPDIYFCCSKCPARTYALCLDCYSTKAYVKQHRHYGDDDAFFLDYTVLHNTIKPTPAHTSEVSGSGSSSTAIVRTNPRDNKWVTAFEVGKAILNAGAAVLSIASTLGGCTIM